VLLAFSLAIACAVGVAALRGPNDAIDFVSAYVLEDSLSVDNLFVFISLFEYFKVPLRQQKVALRYGIIGAIVLRGIFISAGLAALDAFQPLFLVFGVFLMGTSAVALSGGDDDDDDDDLSENAVVKFAQSTIGKTSSEFDGDKFFVQKDGETLATPLLLVLLCVELSDIVFAVDSVPAVFGVTSDPVLVYSSNILAILGLRSLYQVLAKAVQDLNYLENAVGIVLGFVGLKLTVSFFGQEIPSAVSLGIIFTLLTGGVVLSKLSEDERSDNPPKPYWTQVTKPFQGDKKNSRDSE